MSKIQKILSAAVELQPKTGETINSEAYVKRLVLAVGELSDGDWNKIPENAQDFTNAASDALNAKKPLPAWPDAEAEAEAPARSRRRSAEPDAETATGYTPVKGDKVKIVTSRDKQYEGVVVDPDDKGELVLLIGDEELGFSHDKIKSVTPEAKKEAEPAPRRRKAADDDEPPARLEPEVSDTVELVTSRDKTYVGNIVEISDEVLVIKTAAGEELEFDKAKLKSVTVKVKNAKVAEASASRRKASETKDADTKPVGKATKTTKEDNGGVSVTTRARELMCDDLTASKEDVMKLLKKEGLEFKENTIQLIFGDVQKLVKMLRERKLMK